MTSLDAEEVGAEQPDYQVRESAGIYLLYKALYYGIAISCASESALIRPALLVR